MELPSHHEDRQKGIFQEAAGSMSCITCRKATQRGEGVTFPISVWREPLE